MFNTRALFSFLIFSLVGGASVNAMAQSIDEVALDRVDCPLTLQPQKPVGWSVVEKEPAHVLQRMAFFSDHPEYGEELGPQEHRRKDNLVLERWTFQTEGERPWMACVYERRRWWRVPYLRELNSAMLDTPWRPTKRMY